MSGRSGPLSPNSTDGSQWSGYGPHQSSWQPPYSPSIPHHRGNLVTPPISGSSNGTQPRMSNGMNRRPGDPSPPNSIARSSYGTNVSSSDHQRRKTIQMEERLLQHYGILKRYLAQSLRDEKGNPKPNRARDKLLRLSAIQFQELSTDVYDELLRRQSASGQQTNGPGQVPTYLLPKENFHPKRNQARQKLATLPPPRFRDLATDVFYELERRFPNFVGRDIPRNGSPALSMSGPSRVGTPNGLRPDSRGPPGRPPPRGASLGSQVMAGLGIPGVGQDETYGRPTAKSSQSNTIIPNKSTMVEDDDDDNVSGIYGSRRDTSFTSRSIGGSEKDRKMVAELEVQVGDLQGKLKELEDQIQDKDTELSRLRESSNERDNINGAEREKWQGLQSGLEEKLGEARSLNESLQSELEKVRNEHTTNERELRSQMDAMAGQANGGNEWKIRYESLDKAHQELRTELLRQEKTTSEVKQEASGFLNQMKVLSERSGQSFEREEKLLHQLHTLENEVKEWKSRYARTRTQVRTLKTSSMAMSVQPPDAAKISEDGGFLEQNGLVKDVHVTKFQIAIDELLRSARGAEARAVLTHVKSVVISVRNISLDIGDTQASSDESTQQVHKLKAKVSATGNNLITASKNYALSNGLSPVSLLDAAASHLSASVIELIRIVKMRPTSAADLGDDDDNSVIADSPADYYGITNGRSSAGGDSVYSVLSSPQHAQNTFVPNSQSKDPTPNGVPNGVQPPAGPKPTHGIYRGSDTRIDELKTFLDTRTASLVSCIQSLVTSVRTSAPQEDILDNIQAITSTASQIIEHSTASVPLHTQAKSAAQRLAQSVERLEAAGREGEEIQDEKDWKQFVQELPPLAFAIAKETKELGAWVDGGEDDEFS